VNVVTPPSISAADETNSDPSEANVPSPGVSAQSGPPAQATPASIIVAQWPAAGQKVFAGAAVNFDVR
jgi:hypothetical protein